jgi:class 3 adenylate cyclase
LTTQNVAILFTDVVGSTAYVPDAADELRRGHFSILRQALAEKGGNEVKSLGDGLMVVFASASTALECAVAMQQGVERDNRLRVHAVGLRVGLSGGEVTVEEGDYFGDPVIEAARLCTACEGGQVLATDTLRAMAGRRIRNQCRSLGVMSLKGLPEPVAIVDVLWEPLDSAETGIATTVHSSPEIPRSKTAPRHRSVIPRPKLSRVSGRYRTIFIALGVLIASLAASMLALILLGGSSEAAPKIGSVSTVLATPNQTITISGANFGSQAAFNGVLPCIALKDKTGGWGAGHAVPIGKPKGAGGSCGTPQTNNDDQNDVVSVRVTKWDKTTIVISELTGAYGTSYNGVKCALVPGDIVSVRVWNAQSGAGPGTVSTVVIP